MNVTAAVKAKVEAKLKACHKMAEAHYGRTFDFPTIKYTVRGTTGGWAQGTKLVNFNAQLLMENEALFISRTVPHELAHCIDYVVNSHNHTARAFGRKRKVHGADWKRVMGVLGAANATRCHKYDTTNSRVREKTRHEWKCTCGEVMKMGPGQHKKQLLDQDMYRPRGKGCRRRNAAHVYTYVGVVGATPAPPAPKKPKATKAAASHNRPGSKKARAEAIYRNSTQDRAAIIARFMSSLDMTAAGAATYYANCKKKFG